MGEINSFIDNEARGLYRWERDEGWEKDSDLCQFEEGDAVTIDPFRDRRKHSHILWPIYCEFLEYVTDDIAKVYIPSGSEEGSTNCWFQHGEGEYLIHEGYLTPQ